MNGHVVAVFAGSRCGEDHQHELLAFALGEALARAGYIVVNGGGMGLMEETARGAINNGGQVIAVQFAVKGLGQSNYFTKAYKHRRLSTRQSKIMKLAEAYIALPGGIGTFFEAWEILAKKQAMEMPVEVPLIFLSKYWEEQIQIMSSIVAEGFGHESILKYYDFLQFPDEVVVELDKYFKTKA